LVGAQTTRNGAVAIDWHTTRTQPVCDEQRVVVIWNDLPLRQRLQKERLAEPKYWLRSEASVQIRHE
jgi:hypothetical protein